MAGRDFEVMGLLRASCPLMSSDNVDVKNARRTLDRLKADVAALSEMMGEGKQTSAREALSFIAARELFVLEDRLLAYLNGTVANADQPEEAQGEPAAVTAFLNCPVSQLWRYETYVENQSPFETHQGVKGAEFQRVLVLLDDAEANYSLFSFGKYFGITPLSNTDEANIAEGKESVIERTRRLLYVCCSRAVSDLAVVLFAPPEKVQSAIEHAATYFQAEDVHSAADLPA